MWSIYHEIQWRIFLCSLKLLRMDFHFQSLIMHFHSFHVFSLSFLPSEMHFKEEKVILVSIPEIDGISLEIIFQKTLQITANDIRRAVRPELYVLFCREYKREKEKIAKKSS